MVAQRKLKKQWANQITVRPIDWLWRPWLARGVVSVIDGYPGVGKSTLMFDLIARVTTGRPMPFENRQGDTETRRQGEETCNPPPVPGRVVLMPLEDPEDSVVAPRLKSAGVDMANVAWATWRRQRRRRGTAAIAARPRLARGRMRRNAPGIASDRPFLRGTRRR
jgi:AAA domain